MNIALSGAYLFVDICSRMDPKTLTKFIILTKQFYSKRHLICKSKIDFKYYHNLFNCLNTSFHMNFPNINTLVICSVWFGNYYTFWNNHSINYYHYQIYPYARLSAHNYLTRKLNPLGLVVLNVCSL